MGRTKADQFFVPDEYTFSPPWTRITSSDEADRFSAELLMDEPQLADALPLAVARRVDNGDVLFNFLEARAVRQGGFPFGVMGSKEDRTPDPKRGGRISFFECWSHWESDWFR